MAKLFCDTKLTSELLMPGVAQERKTHQNFQYFFPLSVCAVNFWISLLKSTDMASFYYDFLIAISMMTSSILGKVLKIYPKDGQNV